jgi:hypothetical protein
MEYEGSFMCVHQSSLLDLPQPVGSASDLHTIFFEDSLNILSPLSNSMNFYKYFSPPVSGKYFIHLILLDLITIITDLEPRTDTRRSDFI